MKCQQVQLQHQCVLLSNGSHSQPSEVETYFVDIFVFYVYIYICFDDSVIDLSLVPFVVEDAFCKFLA